MWRREGWGSAWPNPPLDCPPLAAKTLCCKPANPGPLGQWEFGRLGATLTWLAVCRCYLQCRSRNSGTSLRSLESPVDPSCYHLLQLMIPVKLPIAAPPSCHKEVLPCQQIHLLKSSLPDWPALSQSRHSRQMAAPWPPHPALSLVYLLSLQLRRFFFTIIYSNRTVGNYNFKSGFRYFGFTQTSRNPISSAGLDLPGNGAHFPRKTLAMQGLFTPGSVACSTKLPVVSEALGGGWVTSLEWRDPGMTTVGGGGLGRGWVTTMGRRVLEGG